MKSKANLVAIIDSSGSDRARSGDFKNPSRLRRWLRVLAPALGAVVLLTVGSSSAIAAPPAEFGSEGTGAGQISSEAQRIAVDNEGSVYVADNHNRIDKFDLLANFLLRPAALCTGAVA